MAFVLPNIHIDEPAKNEPLTVELSQPKVTQPEPVDIPEPAPEMPPPPPETVKPKPVIKPDVKPILPPTPSPVTEPASTPPPAETRPPSPAVITAEPKAEAKPAFTAPAPEPQRPVGPSQQDIDSARNQYGNMLSNQLAKYKNYPRIAVTRGYEGDATLEFKLDANGNLISCTIVKSSGYPSLDNEALESVKKASPFPLPPDSLRGRSFTILVPVSFRLDN